jgi:hypothetical protein
VKTYNLCISPLLRVVPFAFLLVFAFALPWMILTAHELPGLVILPAVAIMGWQWWVLLTLVHRILLHEDGSIEWVALARRVKTQPEDLREIGPDSTGSIGFFRVVHASGKIRFLNQITGFHEVLIHIKARNPTIVLKGC